MVFWATLIIAWMLIHRGTGGRYILSTVQPTKKNATQVFLVALVAALIAIFAELASLWELLIAAFFWYSILYLRSAKTETVIIPDIKSAKAARRGDLRDRPAGSIPHKHSASGKFSSKGMAPEQYSQYRTQKEDVSAGAHNKKLSPEKYQQYHSELDEATSIAREVLQMNEQPVDRLAPPDSAMPSPDLQQEPSFVQAYVEDADYIEEPLPTEYSAEQFDAAAPQEQSEEISAEAAVSDSRSWQAPEFDKRTSMAASSTPQQRPTSIFGNIGPTNLGRSVGSIFDGPAQQQGKVPAVNAVDELIAHNQLSNHAELAKPKSVLEEAEKETGGGFHYKPTAGVKSRF